MRILWLSLWFPYPPDNGSKIRIYNLIRQVASVHEVSLLSFAGTGEARPEHIAHLRTFCVDVKTLPRPIYQPTRLQARLGFFSRWPRSLVDEYCQQMADYLQSALSTADVVVATQYQTMRYLELASTLPAVLEEVELTRFHSDVTEAQSVRSRFRARLRLWKMENSIQRLMRHGVAVTVASQAERANVERIAPPDAKIAVVPNGVDTQVNHPVSEVAQSNRLIYSGAVTYDANYDAVRYFIHDVLPLVRQQVPDAQFTVTGGTGSVDISNLAAQPGVTFTGYLPDIAPAVRSSWAAVVPLRKGGGTRLKILEAMALGTPVISTSKGAEGLDIHPGQDILIADTPQEFAQAAVTLLHDADLRARLSQAGRTLVEREYDWSVIARQLNNLIEQVARHKSQRV